jgi:biotin carboxylase
MRVLVLSTSRPGHIALKDLNCEIIAFIRLKDGIASDLETGYQSLHYFSDDAPVEEYIAIATVLHKTKPFDAVCSFNDNAQDKCIAINRALGLQYSLTETVLKRVYDKKTMRECLKKAGLDNTPQMAVTNIEQVCKFAIQYGYPLILKPIDSTGSKGVSRINCDSDILAAFGKLEPGSLAIVEKFIVGKELSIESFSENGQHQVIAITEKFKDPDNFIEIGHVVPAPINEVQRQQVSTYVQNVLQCLEVIDGPTHTEVILTEHGPVIVETHTRPGGDRIDKLVKIAYGVDIFELSARQIIGHKVLNAAVPPAIHRFAAIWFAAPEMTRPHKIKAISNVELAKSAQGVTEVKVTATAGMTIHKLEDSFSRSAFVVAEGDSYDEALQRAKSAVSKIEFAVSAECL